MNLANVMSIKKTEPEQGLAGMEKQRVVVIQDASREANPTPVRWALEGLLLKPGDKLTLLGVLHEVITPMGYKIKIDTGSKLGADMRIVKESSERKMNEYRNHTELILITKLYEAQKVEFMIEVVAGTSRNDTAVEAARNLKATLVILERQMKKDEKYFLQKLSCGVFRMKNNGRVEELRGPTTSVTYSQPRPTITDNCNGCSIKHDHETTPRSSTREELFSIELLALSENEEVKVTESVENDEDPLPKHGNDLPPSTEDSMLRNGEESSKMSVQRSGDSTCRICNNIKLTGELCKMNFTYEELHAATNGFSPGNSLCDGESIYGFAGKLNNNELKIVVKKSRSSFGEAEFESEVNGLSRARHKNIVRLLGSCSETNHRLVVYEYTCNGLLREHISEESSTLFTWIARIKVALGAARGLLFLHENRLIHRDIRSNNILLTHEFDPLVGYFGLTETKYKSDYSSSEEMNRISEYRAPEYAEFGNVSSKTDVYSFGIVLLELISGRVASHLTTNESSVLGWAKPLMRKKKYRELLDPRLFSSHDPQQLYWIVQVTQFCLTKNPKRRLTMDRVVSALEFISERESCGVIENGIPLSNCP